MSNQFAQVIISIDSKEVEKGFYYKTPDDLKAKIVVGSRVIVPFGRSNKKYEGFIIGFSNKIDFPEENAKTILEVLDENVFSQTFLELAKWMKDKYYTTLLDCLKCITPTGMNFKSDSLISLTIDGQKLGEKQKQIVDFLKENNGKALKSEIENELENINSSINSLKAKGIIEETDESKVKNLSLKMKFAYVNYDLENFEEIVEKIMAKDSAQKKILEFLTKNDGMAVSDLKKFLHISNSALNTLAKNNIILIENIVVLRNTVHYNNIIKKPDFMLTNEQTETLDFINNKKDNKPVLIHGVTGSGKTEIYMQLIERAISNGKTAIMLVPEISLTPQTVDNFISRFGEKVSVTHSRLTIGERYDQWKKAKDGKISIMIGPRSAVFTPFENLGVIVLDEEHEKTYKSESSPKYSTKEVAIWRGQNEGALVILGSATPSIESYYQAKIGIYDLITILDRVNHNFPAVSVVDMRQELEMGNISIFSMPLLKAMEENLKTGEQIILFLNRRGFSTFVSCRKCGYVMTCDNCNVNYTYHRYSDKLSCHYCGKKVNNPKNCPQCGSKFIKYFGVGTQKIEEEVKKIFPSVSIVRMDMDTTAGKYKHETLLNRFRNKEAQILIGTQMIAKGLDFPDVTLVGIIAADLSLNNGDFRSGETTYQLITQVSGRAGRAEKTGKVFIQTYNPWHYGIIYAKDNDYINFYEHEMTLRRQMVYPPFSHIFSILFTGEDEKKIITNLFKLLNIMNGYNKNGQFEMLGPTAAVISKIKRRYRWRMMVKGLEEEKLKNFVLYCVEKLKEGEDVSGININLTLDPSVMV